MQLPLSLTLLLVALILGQLLLALVMLLAVLMLLVLALLLASVKAWEGQNVVVPRSLVQAVQQHHLSPILILKRDR